jgi:ComF family protein
MFLRHIQSLVGDVVDLVYPTTCAVCSTHFHGRDPLCSDCLSDLQRQCEEASCPCCAKPLVRAGDPCPYCEGKGEPNFERIVRLTVYADPVRHLIYQMKFHRRWPLAEFLADQLLRQMAVRELLAAGDCLVPVPLHPLRQMSRGFNQAEVLARRLAAGTPHSIGRASRMRLVQPLIRLRNTELQTKVHSRVRRERNVREAFGLVAPRKIADRHVVIVDDITTTGATLQAVARALKPAKPASLSALVVAIADPNGRDFEMI